MKSTLSTTPEPNETSPETFKLSSSTMLGIDLKRARKLATYNSSEKNHKSQPHSSFFHDSRVSSMQFLYRLIDKILMIKMAYLFELRTKLNWRVRWLHSGWVADDVAIDQGIEIRLWDRKMRSAVVSSWYQTRKHGDGFRYTCTSNKSDVAFTGRNLDRGTLMPIAFSKN